MSPFKLDIGAGNKSSEGWTSFGLEPHHEIYGDVTDMPLDDDTVDEARAIHVIEHVYPWDALRTLKEWLRILKPGGLLILELPDLAKCCANFLAGTHPRKGILGIYGDIEGGDVLMLHKTGYTPQSLRALLREAGFTKVRQRLPEFHGKKYDRDMRLEARKPGGEVHA